MTTTETHLTIMLGVLTVSHLILVSVVWSMLRHLPEEQK